VAFQPAFLVCFYGFSQAGKPAPPISQDPPGGTVLRGKGRSVRNLLTITWYEFRMQVKSGRFKAMCALALLMAFGLYQGGANSLSLPPLNTFLHPEALPYYLFATALAGVFPVGRIRKGGIHSILMVRPFDTFTLALGQAAGALFSLLIPLSIILFPAGLLLRYQFSVDYPLPPLLYVALFRLVPGAFCVIALSIWVRACFKNNIMALIILGFIFAGTTLLANSRSLNLWTTGGIYHNFVPFVSFFSKTYWRTMRDRYSSIGIGSFRNTAPWLEFLFCLILAATFLLLSCYHLRRTEPHRKIIGNYGKRWFHTPTFLRMACDLKIDPHMGLRTHLCLAVLTAFLLVKLVWPVMEPWWKNTWGVMAGKSAAATTANKGKNRYDLSKILPERILPIRILGDNQVLGPKFAESDLRFSHAGSTSGTLAILLFGERKEYKIDEIRLEGRPIRFFQQGMAHFIEGPEFEGLLDGSPHHCTIRASRSAISGGSVPNTENEFAPSTRGFYFAKAKKASGGDSPTWYPDGDLTTLWPTTLTLRVDPRSQVLASPVAPDPERTDAAPAKGNSKPAEKTLVFRIPAERNSGNARILTAVSGMESMDLPLPDCTIRFIVRSKHRDLFREILDLAKPELGEFCRLYGIASAEPLVIAVESQNELDEIRRYRVRTRDGTRKVWQWWTDNALRNLDEIEKTLLREVLFEALSGWGPNNPNSLCDFNGFLGSDTDRSMIRPGDRGIAMGDDRGKSNIVRGLNNRLSLKQEYIEPRFSPVNRHLDGGTAKKIENLTRKQLEENRTVQMPLFQMLYLVIGHEKWMGMLKALGPDLRTAVFTPGMLRGAAEKASGEPLGWFFDYWTNDDSKGYPCYRVEEVRAEAKEEGRDGETQYLVEARIANLGTGRMPVPVRVETSKEPVNDTVWIDSGETVSWSRKVGHLPKKISVDPEGWILMIPYYDKKSGIWISAAACDIKVVKGVQ
jgi:hypothetical protein